METVYEAQDLIEAEIVKDRLIANGINAQVVGQFLQGGLGELPANCYPKVTIQHKHQLENALAVVKAHEAEKRQSTGVDWECDNCGESNYASFELCWSCGEASSDTTNEGSS